MKPLINKIVFFTIGASFILMDDIQEYRLLLVLVMFALTALLELRPNPYLPLVYILCFLGFPSSVYFLPLFILEAGPLLLGCFVIVLILNPQLSLISLSLLAIIIRLYSDKAISIQKELVSLSDASRAKEINDLRQTKALEQHHDLD